MSTSYPLWTSVHGQVNARQIQRVAWRRPTLITFSFRGYRLTMEQDLTDLEIRAMAPVRYIVMGRNQNLARFIVKCVLV